MKSFFSTAIAQILIGAALLAQDSPKITAHRSGSQNQPASSSASSLERMTLEDAELENLRRDTARLKALLNQMRSNLAFVQTSQTPLKHQFELEADAWQVIVEDMDRRVKRMEGHREPATTTK